MKKHIVIIGNGIAGITAARHIRKLSDHSITVISSETRHFFSRTALMYIYMGHMKFEHTKPYEDWFWKKNKIDLVFDHVERIDTIEKKVSLKSGELMAYDDLIIATGSKSNTYDWPGKDLKGVQGLYSYPDLQNMEENTKNIRHAVVVGGGLIGIEVAEMLRSRDIGVTMLVREKEFWSNVLPEEEARMIGHHIRSHHIDLRLSTELKEIISNTEGHVKKVVTSSGDSIDCQFVALCVGVSPNIDWLTGSAIETNRGILVDQFLKTNIDHIFAIGDCVERKYELPGRKTIEQVWYTGRMMGEVVAQTICGNPMPYEPGPWFNSAKFFDIEYQTYGNVPNQTENNLNGFYWEHADGLKAVHVVWEKDSYRFVGINTFGIRMRHACFDAWLQSDKNIHYVMDHLAEANFDPEFFDRYEPEILESFYKTNSEMVPERRNA
ncbi:MAG: NAD(P)/FAD-dependent oxidoreductase [Flammeovirgaceae bacterium]|nr:NAD(P)/FAD-dependent oxidoreductase [Flammeovirgaceae bacterium]